MKKSLWHIVALLGATAIATFIMVASSIASPPITETPGTIGKSKEGMPACYCGAGNNCVCITS